MITLKDDNSSTLIPSGQVLAIMIKLHTGDYVSYNNKNRQSYFIATLPGFPTINAAYNA